MPSTLKRSPAKAQRTYAKTLAAAEEQYEDEGRAHATAWAAVKHSFEKRDDHWERKQRPGPSDPQAAQHGRAAREHPKPTAGGVDMRRPKAELVARAGELGIRGRWRMNKLALAQAIARRQASR